MIDLNVEENEADIDGMRERFLWMARAVAIADVLAGNHFETCEGEDIYQEALLDAESLDKCVAEVVKATQQEKHVR